MKTGNDLKFVLVGALTATLIIMFVAGGYLWYSYPSVINTIICRGAMLVVVIILLFFFILMKPRP